MGNLCFRFDYIDPTKAERGRRGSKGSFALNSEYYNNCSITFILLIVFQIDIIEKLVTFMCYIVFVCVCVSFVVFVSGLV